MKRRCPASAHREIEHRVDPRLDTPSWFLRFGRLDAGPSRVRLDAEFRDEVLGGKRYEAGLSCYFCERHGRDVVIDPPQRGRASYHLGGDYFDTMLALFVPALAHGHVYVFHADLLEVTFPDDEYEDVVIHTYRSGSDGEPVVDPASVRDVIRLATEEALDHVRYGGLRSPPLGALRFRWRTVRDHVEEYDVDEGEDEGEDEASAFRSRRLRSRP